MSGSSGASAGARESADPPTENSEHDRMLETLDTAIDEAHRKIESGRVYDPENEKVRIKWIRALAYCLNVRRQVVTDRDLEDLAEEVEKLKQQQEGHR